MLEVIYVVRHGFRSNWVVDAETGEYSSNIRSPTGIASDPALASYGVQQAEQLATHLQQVSPPIDLLYSSPFYRCLQTLAPFTNALVPQKGANGSVKVITEPGLGEFYGKARFDHPSPASLEVLHTHFPHLDPVRETVIVPSTKGETIPQLHDRVAYCLSHLIARADADPRGPRSLLICTHAASMICIGRALTGSMPKEEGEEDFRCGTCSFSKFVRRKGGAVAKQVGGGVKWDPQRAEEVPDVGWRDGKGVGGGWEVEVNGDCSFLENGEERTWRFSGDESFLKDPNAYNDAKNTAAIADADVTDSLAALNDGAAGVGRGKL